MMERDEVYKMVDHLVGNRVPHIGIEVAKMMAASDTPLSAGEIARALNKDKRVVRRGIGYLKKFHLLADHEGARELQWPIK